MTSTPTKAINRADFVRRYMTDCGLTYVQACYIFDVMVSIMEDAVVTGTKVNFGRLGTLTPIRKAPRTYTMGFKRIKGATIPCRRVYEVGSKVDYKFKVYKEFLKKHSLNWWNDHV